MWFPTVPKVRMRFEEFLVRLEVTDAVISESSKRLNVENSIFGPLPELDELQQRCAKVHQILSEALDRLYGDAVTPRQLASRMPKIEQEISQIEVIADRVRKTINVMRTSEC